MLSIGTEIHHDLIELGGIAQDRTRVLGHRLLDLDGRGKQCPEQSQCVRHQQVQLHGLAFLCRRVAKGENLLDQCSGTVNGMVHVLQMGPGGAGLRNALLNQCGIGHQNGQNIIEVVCNPTG